MNVDLSIYPGGEIVSKGLSDLAHGDLTEEALTVLVGGPRLRELGFEIPSTSVQRPYEHALYESLESRLHRGAHAAYNALLQRLASFVNSYRSE